MSIQMKDVLQAAGPSASLVFASWIFLSFLQQRYVAAFQTFRALVDAYRKGSENAVRLDALESQIRQYRRRCDWMRWSTNIGVVSALCFLATLLCGLVAVILPDPAAVGTAGAVLCSAGFVLVMVSAVFTIVENSLSATALDDEVRDMDSLDRR
jgi:hypothetical protein